MQAVAVALHVYALWPSAEALGYVGLAQFLPVVGLSLITGQVADRFDRRSVLLLCYGGLTLCSLGFYLMAERSTGVAPLYFLLFLTGLARAFGGPAGQSLVPHLVPPHHFSNAVTWGSTLFQAANIVGPAIGGTVYRMVQRPAPVYLLCTVLSALSFSLVVALRVRTGRMDKAAVSIEQLLAGLRYVWNQKIILGAISLDLFAVLLGGAVALMPIFAQKILFVGPSGMGILRSAPAAGAAVVAVGIAYLPLRRNIGRWMFGAVAIFGTATIVFGLSKSFLLSVAALVIIGASDMVSVVVRSTLIQTRTPDEMRGRVGAVNMVFIGASNELGEFESGVTAEWLTPRIAVLVGGIGTCVVVVVWALMFPALRDVDRLDE